MGRYQKRRWNGKYGEIYTYRNANHLHLRGGTDTLKVNWVELTITHEATGELIYKNAFVTDFEVLETTVEAIARDGRARWKIENENNNILKTKGYHLEYNFGHGSQFLSSLLLSLNLLAFLFHTAMGLVDKKYQLLRKELHKRRKFFRHVEALFEYLLFDSWDSLFSFMCRGLNSTPADRSALPIPNLTIATPGFRRFLIPGYPFPPF
ncbi:MAG: hypothetical protein ABI904_16590 [Chloroflexota bacterium]